MDNSSINSSSSNLDNTKNIAYICVGTCSMTVNILTLLSLIKDKKLLQKSPVLVGIAIANCSVSMHIIGMGAYRYDIGELADQETTAQSCASMILILFYPISYVSEGLFICFGGLERVLAINAPIWFRNTWKQIGWKITGILYLIVITYVAIGAILSFYQPMATRNCGASDTFGDTYQLICQGVSALGGALGASFAVLALITGIYKASKLQLIDGNAGQLRKQLRLTKSMSMVAVLDLGLVGIPNILSIVKVIIPGTVLPDFVKGSNANFTFCANAMIMIVALTWFCKDFRQSLIKVLHSKKVIVIVNMVGPCNKNMVQPLNGSRI